MSVDTSLSKFQTTILPNLFVIGAHKAGTTSVCEFLAAHPDVFFSSPKEPGFFTVPKRQKRGWSWYCSLFAEAEGYAVVAEGSTTHSMVGIYPQIVEQLSNLNPNARILYLVRHPLRRAESHWMQWSDMDIAMPSSFNRAVREEPAILDSSLYWKQIDAYRTVFGDERILVLFFEDFVADPVGVMRRVFNFLGIPADVPLSEPERPRNSFQGKRRDGMVLDLLRRTPGYRAVRDRWIPASLRRTFKPMFTQEIRERPTWDEATRQWYVEQIRDDLKHFLEFYGKPTDFYELDRKGCVTCK